MTSMQSNSSNSCKSIPTLNLYKSVIALLASVTLSTWHFLNFSNSSVFEGYTVYEIALCAVFCAHKDVYGLVVLIAQVSHDSIMLLLRSRFLVVCHFLGKIIKWKVQIYFIYSYSIPLSFLIFIIPLLSEDLIEQRWIELLFIPFILFRIMLCWLLLLIFIFIFFFFLFCSKVLFVFPLNFSLLILFSFLFLDNNFSFHYFYFLS